MHWWGYKGAPKDVGSVRIFGGRIAEATMAEWLGTDLTGQKPVNFRTKKVEAGESLGLPVTFQFDVPAGAFEEAGGLWARMARICSRPWATCSGVNLRCAEF